MNNRKILIVDDMHPIFQNEAEKLGFSVDYKPQFTLADVLPVIHEYTGLAIRSKFNITKEVIDAATSLKFIARAGAGMDNIDESYARENNIICLNAPEGNRDAVAEHAIGLLLSLMNKFQKGNQEVKNGIWDREGNRGYELKGKTVGIIGYGNTGQSLARKLKGFEVNVIAFDKYKTGYSDGYASEVSMEQIVKLVDVISFHIPLTRETRQMVDTEYLFHFKKPIFLINTARGEIIDTKAVVNAIKENRILGAGLDVLEVEKFPKLSEQGWYQELVNTDKAILTPHVAGWTFDSYRKISEVLADKLKALSVRL